MFGKTPSCQEVDSFLTEYLEGTLDEKTVRMFEDHIAMCPLCVTYLEQYKQAIEVTSSHHVEVPPELAEQTIAFLHSNLD